MAELFPKRNGKTKRWISEHLNVLLAGRYVQEMRMYKEPLHVEELQGELNNFKIVIRSEMKKNPEKVY